MPETFRKWWQLEMPETFYPYLQHREDLRNNKDIYQILGQHSLVVKKIYHITRHRIHFNIFFFIETML